MAIWVVCNYCMHSQLEKETVTASLHFFGWLLPNPSCPWITVTVVHSKVNDFTVMFGGTIRTCCIMAIYCRWLSGAHLSLLFCFNHVYVCAHNNYASQKGMMAVSSYDSTTLNPNCPRITVTVNHPNQSIGRVCNNALEKNNMRIKKRRSFRLVILTTQHTTVKKVALDGLLLAPHTCEQMVAMIP